jgi:hypothetical protein
MNMNITPSSLRRALLIAAAWLALAAPSALAQSQASTGQIVGSVRDSAGAAVPNATVRAANTQTGLSQTATTGDEGLFRFVLLPPGVYNITVEASGFSRTEANNIKVNVGQSVDANITLGVGNVQETINVSADAIQTTQSQPDALVNETAIANLPINGRRFQDFITLTPTAQVTGDTRGQISISGQRGINSNISVDGTDYNQPFFGGIRGGERSNTAFTIPQESIKEFQVVAAGYSAEFGRSTGGIVNAVTKSGTNEFHGTGFYLIRHRELSRNHQFFEDLEAQLGRKVTAAPTQQQWGGSVGGPIKKDKFFFFGSYEQQRFRNPREVVFDFGTGFTPTANSREAYDYYQSLQVPFTATNDARAFLVKVDYNFSEANRFNVRYSRSVNEALNSNATGNALFPNTQSALSNNGTERNDSNTVVAQLTSFFGSTLVNELRGQYSRERRPRDANQPLSPNVNSVIGDFGTVRFLGENIQTDWRAQVFNNVTWILGNHSVKFGAEVNHTYADQKFGFNQTGRFAIVGSNRETILDILSVGGTIANRFDDPSVTYDRQIGNLTLALDTDEYSMFAQDAWRIRPNFTLNYGLRWEAQFNPQPEANNSSLVDRVRGFRFPSGHTVDPTFIPDSADQFAPRAGFAWDPFSDTKTVVRGYGGIYYARTPGLLFAAPLNNFRTPPGDVSIRLPIALPANYPNRANFDTVYEQLRLIGVNLNNFTLDKLPILTPQQVQSVAAALGLTADPFRGANVLTWASDYRNPKSYQWGGGIERQLTSGLTVGIDYSHVKTVYLQRNRDLNVPAPLASISEMPQLGNPNLKVNIQDPAQRPFYGLRGDTRTSIPADQRYAARQRPIPTLGQVQLRESTAKSLYRAMTARLIWRRKWGQVNAFYTLSKNLSDDDNERDSGGTSFDNAYNLASEYSFSRLDRRHQFVANPVFFLPAGFEVSSAIRLRSGLAFDAAYGADINEDLSSNFIDRPFSAPGVPFKRNAFRNRPVYDVDLRVQKGISLGEQRRLIFSTEIFNLFNFENVTLFGATVANYCANPVPRNCGFPGTQTNTNFLQVKGANGRYITSNNPGAPFQVQFGARFQF